MGHTLQFARARSASSSSVGSLMVRRTGRRRSFVSYRSIIDRVILPRFGTTLLRKLRAADIDAFYAELRKRGGANGAGLSAASVRRIHSVLRRALAQAVKWGLLTANPAANASPPREPHREASVPTA
jgi:site-specific recombinase XerC